MTRQATGELISATSIDVCRMRYHGALRSRRLMLLHELVHRMDRDVRQARTIIDELKPQKERNDERKTEEA